MVFLGDIAHPGSKTYTVNGLPNSFKEQYIVANLEGPLVNSPGKYLKKHILFNDQSLFDGLKGINFTLMNLANNHIMDLGAEGLRNTQLALSNNGYKYLGAGEDLDSAAKPVTLKLSNKEVTFLSFGWEVIQCKRATDKFSGVNPLVPEHVVSSINKAKLKKPDTYIAVLFHWNYELERYPQPRDRELAKLCIDIGADAIIGCHSHLVQGMEIYKEAPIFYGLGNWFIPQNVFFDGALRFPKNTCEQLAVEWTPGEEPICHWFKFFPKKNQIEYEKSERALESRRIDELTPFASLTHSEYIRWFKESRKKNKLLPVYKNIDSPIENYLKDKWVAWRGRLLDTALQLGLKEIRHNLR